MASVQYDYLLKVLMVGDSGTNKADIMLRLCSDSNYSDNSSFITTIGVDFKIKLLQVDETVVKLQIWDTAGQERFRAITSTYYRGSSGIMLVYDITNEKSFQNLSKWLEEIRQHADNNVNIIVLGNKCDLTDHRQVSTERGRQFAAEEGLKFLEVSAKTAENVNEAFLTLSKDMITTARAKVQAK